MEWSGLWVWFRMASMDFPNGSYEGKVNDIRILKESGLQRCLRQLFFSQGR